MCDIEQNEEILPKVQIPNSDSKAEDEIETETEKIDSAKVEVSDEDNVTFESLVKSFFNKFSN